MNMVIGTYLTFVASPPPNLFPLLLLPPPTFSNSSLRPLRVSGLKILQTQESKLFKCYFASKKSVLLPKSDGDDDGGGEKKQSKRSSSRRTRKKSAPPESSEDEAISDIEAVGMRKTLLVQQVLMRDDERGGQSEDKGKTPSDVKMVPRRRSPSKKNMKKTTQEKSKGNDSEEEILPTSNVVEESTKRRKRSSKLAIASSRDSNKVKRKGEEKAISNEVTKSNVTRRKTWRNGDFDSMGESDVEEPEPLKIEVSEAEEMYVTEEDISFTYKWPPLVCCYGAAQHAFIPSGRPSNRIINHKIHDSMKDIIWSPERFMRAPGTSPSSVALALASFGGRVAFMGKIGDDEYGQSMLYHLNVNNVQTRATKIDDTKLTGVSYMKLSERGGFRMTPTQPCAEDSLLSSEINWDVLKEAKFFYFNSSSLLDPNMKITTMRAIRTSRGFGGIIFYDLNLPLPLWQSRDDTIMHIKEAWNLADIVEVTKQELEFICGIEPMEKFDTKDNHKSKFTHYRPEVIMPLWHENLKVLFVTNGTSKAHYYTSNDNGWVHGMEDAPITPFSADMSASGDAMVAALMRMLSVQPHLISDPGYLRHSLKYALSCGITHQWLLARDRGYPPTEQFDGVSSISEREFRTVGRPDIECPDTD